MCILRILKFPASQALFLFFFFECWHLDLPRERCDSNLNMSKQSPYLFFNLSHVLFRSFWTIFIFSYLRLLRKRKARMLQNTDIIHKKDKQQFERLILIYFRLSRGKPGRKVPTNAGNLTKRVIDSGKCDSTRLLSRHRMDYILQ